MSFLHTILTILEIFILVHALSTWISGNMSETILRFTTPVVSPLLRPWQALLPRPGNLDLSPFATIATLELLHYLLRFLF